jgi:proline iminopeptidase
MKTSPDWKRRIVLTEFSVTFEALRVSTGVSAEDILYPEIVPNKSGWIKLDHVHTMYWEESGVPDGLPVLVLHGGPGAGTSPRLRRFFDPRRYRIIMFDQRGAGKSTPLGEIALNTTSDLMLDIERLRSLLAIDRWMLFGGSWGSALALAYAEAYPERCSGLVLRGIYLGESDEIDWHMNGLKRFAPEAWEDFVRAIASNEQSNLLAAYRERLNDPDPAVHMPAALAWNRYESVNIALRPDEDKNVRQPRTAGESLALARLEAHYFGNGCFMREGQLLADIDTLVNCPCIIVHGKYDLLTPVRNAYRLHKALPGSRLVIVPDAGHSAFEHSTVRELLAATEYFARSGVPRK